MATTTFGVVFRGRSKKGTVVNELKPAKKDASVPTSDPAIQPKPTEPEPTVGDSGDDDSEKE